MGNDSSSVGMSQTTYEFCKRLEFEQLMKENFKPVSYKQLQKTYTITSRVRCKDYEEAKEKRNIFRTMVERDEFICVEREGDVIWLIFAKLK